MTSIATREREAAGGIRYALRTPERILIAYFAYIAVMAMAWSLPVALISTAFAVPVLVCALAVIERAYSRPWSRVLRDFAPLALLLIAYWEVGWFTAPPLTGFENTLLAWDHHVFHVLLLRNFVESAGGVFPTILETSYLLLYAAPVAGVALLYSRGGRERIERFMTTFLLATLTAYALLPHFPTLPPRVAFPGDALPRLWAFDRTANVWIFKHLDIKNSVFPSGHVAAAFATAFGMYRALTSPKPRPMRFAVAGGFFAFATLVLLATIYGRYHYVADGLASIVICVLAYPLAAFVYGRRRAHE